MPHPAAVALALLATALGAPMVAQRFSSGVDRVGVDDIEYALHRISVSESRGVRFHSSQDGNAQFVLNARFDASEVELHCGWDDVLVVRSGYGVLEHGSRVRGERAYTRGEWRARRIVESEEVILKPGDLVRVPAGVAHAVRPLGDAPVVYLVVKNRSARASTRGICGTEQGN